MCIRDRRTPLRAATAPLDPPRSASGAHGRPFSRGSGGAVAPPPERSVRETAGNRWKPLGAASSAAIH
eukprot:15485573-Alexandrium_andersonii.AAC.1